MTNPPDDPGIPTLTRVLKQASNARNTSREAPSSGRPMPRDLDIDLQLDTLDRLPDQARTPATPPAVYGTSGPSHDTRTALQSRVEALVDEVLAAHIGALRERLIADLMRLLSEDPEISMRSSPND